MTAKDGPCWPALAGRLDRDRLGRMLAGLDSTGSVALICGPGPLVTVVSDTLLDLGMPLEKVIYERFDYSSGPSRQDRQRGSRFQMLGAALAVGVLVFLLLMS